jgi:hypothetical protein
LFVLTRSVQAFPCRQTAQEKAGGSMDGITTLAPNLQFSPSIAFPSTESVKYAPESIDLYWLPR